MSGSEKTLDAGAICSGPSQTGGEVLDVEDILVLPVLVKEDDRKD